jgi:catechol 2,3-dioxygenase-like lactoylglutathione lyase family enzyme
MPAISAQSLDHVALWVAERDPLAAFLCDRLGMHVIERDDNFTLVGVDAKRGKLTLFEAEGPRERGVLERIALRVRDLDAATAALSPHVELVRREGGAELELSGGLRLGLVQRSGIDYDLDHVVLRTPEAEATAERLAQLGFERHNGALEVADRRIVVEGGGEPEAERPLLNHLALLVESVERIGSEAESKGFEIEKTVDAENTLAVFVRGPDGILIEFVEHKPGFSLE